MIARRRKYIGLHLPPGVEVRLGKRVTTYRYQNADRSWTNLGHDLETAKKRAEELNRSTPKPNTVAHWFEEYFSSAWFKRLASRTQVDYQECAKSSGKLMQVFSQMQFQQIKRPHIAKYRDMRSATAARRANTEITLLSVVCQFAMERDESIKENPCKGVRRIPQHKRSRDVARDERLAYLEMAKGMSEGLYKIALMGEFAFLTGQRRAGLLKCSLSNLKDHGIEFQSTKHKSNEDSATIVIQWSPALRQCIESIRSLSRPVVTLRDPLLFCTLSGNPYTDSGFKGQWNKLQQEWAKRGHTRFHFHDLLAAHVTAKKSRGEDVRDTRGHTTEATGERVYDRRRIRIGTPAE